MQLYIIVHCLFKTTTLSSVDVFDFYVLRFRQQTTLACLKKRRNNNERRKQKKNGNESACLNDDEVYCVSNNWRLTKWRLVVNESTHARTNEFSIFLLCETTLFRPECVLHCIRRTLFTFISRHDVMKLCWLLL